MPPTTTTKANCNFKVLSLDEFNQMAESMAGLFLINPIFYLPSLLYL